MEDVTDFPFRQVLLKIGGPDILFTEFVNVDGLTSRGQKHVNHRLEKTESHDPIIIQFWGNNPEKFVESVKIVKDLNFQGVNINLGCPVKKVLKSGCGSALIGKYDVVEKIVDDLNKLKLNVPVSIKTRLGIEKFDKDWMIFLLKLKIETIFLHGRTAKQVFGGNADWDLIKEVVDMKQAISPEIKIVGNGDVKSISQANEYMQKYWVDGVMIGREVLKNPWVFTNHKPTVEERLKTLLYHFDEMQNFTERFPDKGWQSMKKFYYGYLREDERLVSLRKELFQITSLEVTKQRILEEMVLLKEK